MKKTLTEQEKHRMQLLAGIISEIKVNDPNFTGNNKS